MYGQDNRPLAFSVLTDDRGYSRFEIIAIYGSDRIAQAVVGVEIEPGLQEAARK